MTSKNFMRLVAISMVAVQCGQSEKPEGFGLTAFVIEMDEEEIGRMNSSITDKVALKSRVRINNQIFSVKINYAGRTSLDAYKKSYDVEFLDGPYQHYKRLRLSAQASDPSLLSSLVGYHTYKLAGIPSPDSQPVVVYLNREYLGLYVMMEKVDLDFFHTRQMNVDALYKAHYNDQAIDRSMRSNPKRAWSAKHNPKHFHDIEALVDAVLSSTSSSLEPLDAVLDLDSFLSYHAATVVLDNWDGFNNNYYLYRQGGVQKMQFAAWDVDRSYQNAKVTTLGIGTLAELILSNPAKREEFRIRCGEILATLETADIPGFIRSRSLLIRDAFHQDPTLGSKLELDQMTDTMIERYQSKIAQIQQFVEGK